MLPPRILLVMPDQWPRALLRAELRELGYDASGTRSLGVARYQVTAAPERGPVRLVVLDQDAVDDGGTDLEALRRVTDAPVVLLAPTLRDARPGDWVHVLRRPFTIGELTRLIERLVPLPPDARHPIDASG